MLILTLLIAVIDRKIISEAIKENEITINGSSSNLNRIVFNKINPDMLQICASEIFFSRSYVFKYAVKHVEKYLRQT